MRHDHKLETKTLTIEGKNLTINDVVRVGLARPGDINILLSESAAEKINKSRKIVEKILDDGLIVYGINTGFGSYAEKVISREETELLQRYLIKSHATGAGDPYSPEIIRSAMLIRANTHARGNSGIRLKLVQILLDMLNKGVVPYVPEHGSLGASGDLAPLSHIALCLSKDPKSNRAEERLTKKAKAGETFTIQETREAIKESGEAYLWQGSSWVKMTGIEAMAKAGIDRIALEAKEGLALNNGCSVSAATSCFVIHFGERAQQSADLIAALVMEAVGGFESAFSCEINDSRPYYGQMEVARRIREYIKDSGVAKHVDEIQNSKNVMNDFNKVQDSYSIRCIPQVHGPVLDALEYAKSVISIEINAATDNPLIFPDSNYINKAFSGGNFHGQNISLSIDFLSIALCTLGNISERRIFKLMENRLNGGLPDFLIHPVSGKHGLMSGAMIMQYTAASLASENKVLSHPASADSITSSADREDFVSMAPISARKTYRILDNLENILAIECWCSIIALRLRHEEKAKLSRTATNTLNFMKEDISEFNEDRVTYDEVKWIKSLIHSGELLKAASK